MSAPALLELAVEIANTGNLQRHYMMACVAVRRDGVIVKSTNSMVHRPATAAHAEIRTAKKAGAGAYYYVARVKRDGTWGMARPCVTCFRVLHMKRAVKIFYTIGPDEWGSINCKEIKK